MGLACIAEEAATKPGASVGLLVSHGCIVGQALLTLGNQDTRRRRCPSNSDEYLQRSEFPQQVVHLSFSFSESNDFSNYPLNIMCTVSPQIAADAARFSLDIWQIQELGQKAIQAKDRAYCM